MKLDMKCPDYSVLSRRLSQLNIKAPYYRKIHKHTQKIVAIVIDSTGLSCFDEREWRQVKQEVNDRKNWRKLHISMDNDGIIQSCVGTHHDTHDAKPAEHLLEPLQSCETNHR